jgi:hypothetical protein
LLDHEVVEVMADALAIGNESKLALVLLVLFEAEQPLFELTPFGLDARVPATGGSALRGGQSSVMETVAPASLAAFVSGSFEAAARVTSAVSRGPSR